MTSNNFGNVIGHHCQYVAHDCRRIPFGKEQAIECCNPHLSIISVPVAKVNEPNYFWASKEDYLVNGKNIFGWLGTRLAMPSII